MPIIPAGNRPSYTMAADLFITQLFETSGGIVIYQGYAEPGTGSGSTGWAIKKLTYDGSDAITGIVWASGNNQFDKVWNSRGSYTYT